MTAKCTLQLEYKSDREAELVFKATKIENEGFVEAMVKDSVLIANINSDNLHSLNHTLEDYLSCISVAEKTIKHR